jgi:hypothetical protein
MPPLQGVDDGVQGFGVFGGSEGKATTTSTGPGPLGTGVMGENSGGGTGVWGHSATGDGIFGLGARNGVHGQSASAKDSGVWGENTGGGVGVAGSSVSGNGVVGTSNSPAGTTSDNTSTNVGVVGVSLNGDGIFGHGTRNGVHGQSASAHDSGVWGENTSSGTGIAGSSEGGAGVSGTSNSGVGVNGNSTIGTGVTGTGKLIGVNGQSGAGPGVAGSSLSGPGVTGSSDTGNAGEFDGNVLVTGNITVNGDITLANADCAEDFEIAEFGRDPGTVVVIDDAGVLKCCGRDYDNRVAGVVSGAGHLRPGIILGRQAPEQRRRPVALVGKVYCKVDAERSPIAVGDLLTTSATPGHAMRATDRDQAFGAVIGKALGPLESGQGIIPILVALQ